MKRPMSILFALLTLLTAGGQEYRYEVGPTLGVSGYLGDINTSNMWKHPGIAAGAMFRYIHNSRWAFKANLTYTRLTGDSKDILSKFPQVEPYTFKSNLFDLGAQAEFNFLSFGSGPRYKNYKRLSPYMVAGLGMSLAVTNGKVGTALVLPLGAGLKFKVNERLNLGFEFTMRKAFGDNLDGLGDLYGVPHGFAKNTDWYSLALFSVSYEFSKRCTKCHYVE